MLIPSIYVPAAASIVQEGKEGDEKASSAFLGQLACLQFMNKVSVLGPVMIDIENASQDEEHVKKVMNKVISMTNANNLRPCFLEGLEVDQDTLANGLLDAGLHGVFFKYPTLGGDIELDFFKKVLETFPRARVGVVALITNDVISKGKLAEWIDRIVSVNRSCAVHFYFQFQAQAPGQEVLSQLVAVCKALVEATTSAKDNIQVYVGLPREFYASSKEATCVATAMSDNTLHAVFKARPFAVGASGSSRGGATSATTVRGDTSSSEDGVDILSAFIACVRSDRPDGLFTTVVCDQHGSKSQKRAILP